MEADSRGLFFCLKLVACRLLCCIALEDSYTFELSKGNWHMAY